MLSIVSFLWGRRAVNALEYSLLIGVIAVGAAVAMGEFGTTVSAEIGEAKTRITQIHEP